MWPFRSYSSGEAQAELHDGYQTTPAPGRCCSGSSAALSGSCGHHHCECYPALATCDSVVMLVLRLWHAHMTETLLHGLLASAGPSCSNKGGAAGCCGSRRPGVSWYHHRHSEEQRAGGRPDRRWAAQCEGPGGQSPGPCSHCALHLRGSQCLRPLLAGCRPSRARCAQGVQPISRLLRSVLSWEWVWHSLPYGPLTMAPHVPPRMCRLPRGSSRTQQRTQQCWQPRRPW